MSEDDELKVLTLNTWGLLYISQDLDLRMKAIGEELSKGEWDIVFLQEVWTQSHYNVISRAVKQTLPFSHYFQSGFLGSGCAIFSRYSLVDTLYHKYSLNGYPWDYTHCDWYAGKGVAYAVVQHPRRLIHTFNTHVHADDPEGKNCRGIDETRTLQCYQLARFVNTVTRSGDAIIVSGDMNHVPGSLGIRTIRELASLSDSYDIASDKPAVCFTVDKKVNRYLPEKEITSRLDYIFVSDAFQCKHCGLAMHKIPNTNMHYSDHTGYSATLTFQKESQTSSTTSYSKDTTEVFDLLQKVMRDGEDISNQLNLTNSGIVFIMFILCIVFPLISPEGLTVLWFLLPSSRWNLNMDRLLGVVSAVTSSVVVFVYLWVVIVVRRIHVNEFQAARSHIQMKIKQLETIIS